MRFKDFLITIIISTITSLIIIWTLINAGIIQTQHHSFLKQNYTGTLTGVLNETSKIYGANIERLSIENASEKTAIRLLHISLEANVTNYDPNKETAIDSFQLKNQHTEEIIAEKTSDFKLSYNFLTIDASVSPFHTYYISLRISGDYNFTLTYRLVIIQELFT